MELAKYISELLYRHDCVIVPGFGGFITNPVSAQIDGVRNVYYPPSKKVGFNRKLDHNDGLLINHVSSGKGIDYSDASKLVETMVNDILKDLIKGKRVSFVGIGEFFFDRTDNLQFEPEPLANFSTHAYGLTHFRFPPLRGHSTVLTPENGKRTGSGSERGRIRRYVKYVVAGAPIVAAIVFGSLKTDVIREFSFDISSLNPFTVRVESTLTDTEAEMQPAGSREKEALKTLSSQKEALYYEEGKEYSQVQASQKYHIVAGSFSNYSNAVSLKNDIKNLGYEPAVLETESGMFRVTTGSFENREEALSSLYQTRERMANPDIWLLSR